VKKRLNRFVVDDEAQDWTRDLRFTWANGRQSSSRGGLQEGHRANGVPSCVRLQRGAPFPPPALLVGTTSPSAIPVGPASFSRALPVDP